jgi:hypothetical protein
MSDVAAASAATSAAATPQVRSAWHNPQGFGFRDLLDIINPLQHLPIISSVYRYLTGDQPGAVAQMAGDALYGGPIGVAFSLASEVTEDAQGRDIGERVLADVFGSGKTTAVATAAPATTITAANTTTAASAAPAPLTNVATTGSLAPVHLDHPPMPLFGGIATPPPQAAAAIPAAASTQQTPAQQFLSRYAAANTRPLPSGPRAGGFQPTARVPLDIPAGALPANGIGTPAAQAVSSAPVNISQKMLEGLDKYMALERQREAQGQKPDRSLPAVPAVAPAGPGVDLSL